jgi:NAD(P)-dependent dehydrogenase (short-subunit alcohol dehydrogenase family)
MPMTHSAAYNASKGAAHILTLQMARELRKRHGLTVFGISPNKLHSTGMSDYIDKRVCELRGWTPEEAKAYQCANLPAGEETDPDQLAQLITYLVTETERHKYLNGCILPYGA